MTAPSKRLTPPTSSGERTSASIPADSSTAPIDDAISAVAPCLEAAVTRTLMVVLLVDLGRVVAYGDSTRRVQLGDGADTGPTGIGGVVVGDRSARLARRITAPKPNKLAITDTMPRIGTMATAARTSTPMTAARYGFSWTCVELVWASTHSPIQIAP